jgi:hypothetical protein
MLSGMGNNGMNRLPPPRPFHERSMWTIIGIALVVVLVIGGLVVVGYATLIIVGLSHYGSNK